MGNGNIILQVDHNQSWAVINYIIVIKKYYYHYIFV